MKLKIIPKSLESKLVFVFLGVFILAALFTYLSYQQALRKMKEEFVVRVSELAWTISLQARQFYQNKDFNGFLTYLQGFEQSQSVFAVIAYDQTGKVWVESSAVALTPSEAKVDQNLFKKKMEIQWQAVNEKEGNIVLELIVPVFGPVQLDKTVGEIQTQPIGWLRFMMNRYRFEEALRILIKRIFFNSSLLLFAGIVIFVFLLRRSLKTIPTLSAATEKVASGEFDFNVPIRSGDELGRLAVAFNKMADQLKKTTVSKNYVDNIINSMVDMLVVVSPDGTIKTINQATTNVLGYEANELIGKFVKKIFTKEEEEVFTGAGMEEVFRKGFITNREMTFVTKKGDAIPVSFSSSVMRDAQGQIQGVVCVALDISERKKIEEEKKLVQEQLEQSQKLESMGQLAGGIAHDFNNLLGSILGYASLLKERLRHNVEVSKKLGIIEKSAERAAQLTQQLLEFARKGQYEKRKMSVKDSVEEAMTLLSRSLNKNITIKANYVRDLWPIEGDSSQILQILLNLGINSRDAMPQGGKLRLDCQNFVADDQFCRTHTDLTPGDYVRVSISDTGTGVPKEIQKKIFEPFFTTKEVGKGTGLGLSMVYGIMQNHNGSIAIYSEEGKGATFHLYFPAAKGKLRVKSTTESPAISKDIFLSKTILIVDDEQSMRELAKDILEAKGAKTYLATDGYEAIKVYQTHKDDIDLILLDLTMPKRNGIEVFTEIRAVNPELKVVFSSGFAEGDKISQLRKDGKVDFIQKPFREDQLINKIKDITA